jgi:hypothetical protein
LFSAVLLLLRTLDGADVAVAVMVALEEEAVESAV